MDTGMSHKGMSMGPVVHRLSNIRPDQKVADCAGCGLDVPIVFKSFKGHWRCRVGNRRSNPNPAVQRERQLRCRFGIGVAEYDLLMVEQGGACAICGEACLSGRRLAVDHDHECCPGRSSCGKCVRGLLCGRCNPALGGFRDDPELLLRAIAYLNNY